MHKGDQWRTFTTKERCNLHCLPARMLERLEGASRPRAQLVAARNSLIGNGIHLLSLVTFFAIALQMSRAEVCGDARFSYGPDELGLRQRVNGTIFQPGILPSLPGVLSPMALTTTSSCNFRARRDARGYWRTWPVRSSLDFHLVILHRCSCIGWIRRCEVVSPRDKAQIGPLRGKRAYWRQASVISATQAGRSMASTTLWSQA